MSVIIKGLPMPASCSWCPLCFADCSDQFYCYGVKPFRKLISTPENDLKYERADFCPLEEISDESETAICTEEAKD